MVNRWYRVASERLSSLPLLAKDALDLLQQSLGLPGSVSCVELGLEMERRVADPLLVSAEAVVQLLALHLLSERCPQH